MKFCEKLKLLREERNMNQVEFAKLLGTSKQVISRYERGDNTPKITTVAHYADVLGISLEYFVNDEMDAENKADNTISLREKELTEGERMMLDLFRCIPDDKKEMAIEMIRAALGTKK